MRPVETAALVFLGCFVLVQPWLAFAGPRGVARYALLSDEAAQEALDRAGRWDGTTAAQRTAAEVAVGVLGVLSLVGGFVAGPAWLASVAACLVTIWATSRVRARARATVLEAARQRGTVPSPRTRSTTRRRRQRLFGAVLAASLIGALVAYRSAGFLGLSGNFVSGVLVITATLGLIGLVASNDTTYGDEEPD